MGRCSDKTESQSKWARAALCTDQTVASDRSASGGPLMDERSLQVRLIMRDRDVDVGNRAPPGMGSPAPMGERSGAMR